MHPDSVEKTAFTTPQGFKFRVMPFGLYNACAVFQRLMQQVLQGLNPPEGPDFMFVYIDDVLVFSRTLGDTLITYDWSFSAFRMLASSLSHPGAVLCKKK